MSQPAPAPDLSYIAEPLRPLAVPVGSIDLDPANARVHPQDNLSALRGSLRTFGQRKPVVVNRRTNTVEAGNGTLTAARDLGWSHVAAVFVDDDPTTAAGFAVADNRSAELADWSRDALDALLGTITTEDADLQAMLDALAHEQGLTPAEDAATGDEPAGEDTVPERYQVLVDCADEGQQAKLLEELTTRGFKVRSLMS